MAVVILSLERWQLFAKLNCNGCCSELDNLVITPKTGHCGKAICENKCHKTFLIKVPATNGHCMFLLPTNCDIFALIILNHIDEFVQKYTTKRIWAVWIYDYELTKKKQDDKTFINRISKGSVWMPFDLQFGSCEVGNIDQSNTIYLRKCN